MSIEQCLDCYNTVKVSEVWPCRSVSNTAHMQHKRCPKFQKLYTALKQFQQHYQGYDDDDECYDHQIWLEREIVQ